MEHAASKGLKPRYEWIDQKACLLAPGDFFVKHTQYDWHTFNMSTTGVQSCRFIMRERFCQRTLPVIDYINCIHSYMYINGPFSPNENRNSHLTNPSRKQLWHTFFDAIQGIVKLLWSFFFTLRVSMIGTRRVKLLWRFWRYDIYVTTKRWPEKRGDTT